MTWLFKTILLHNVYNPMWQSQSNFCVITLVAQYSIVQRLSVHAMLL